MYKSGIIIFLFLFAGCSSQTSLYEQNLENAKGALHTGDYLEAIELLEGALIEKPSDEEAESLLNTAKEKQLEIIEKKKYSDDLLMLTNYFGQYIPYFNDGYFMEVSESSGINNYIEKGSKRLERLIQINAFVKGLEAHEDLMDLQNNFVEILEYEIEATKATMDAIQMKVTEQIYSFWEFQVESINEKVPLLENKLKTKSEEIINNSFQDEL